MDHPIEYATPDPHFGLLPFPGAGGQLRPQNALVASHAGLSQAPFMIPSVPFPSFPSHVQDGLHPLVARFNMSIASLGDTLSRIALRRDDRFNRRRPGLGGISQQPMDFLPIISAIAVKPAAVKVWATTSPVWALKPRCRLRQVRRWVQPCCCHSPSPYRFNPVLSATKMARLVGRLRWHRHLQPSVTTRQGRVVRCRQIQRQYLQQRLDKALGLPQGQTKQFTQRQGRLNGLLRVKKWGAALSRSVIPPAIDCFLTQPNRQATVLDQRAIIEAPVFHPVDHFLFRRSGRLARRTTRRYVLL